MLILNLWNNSSTKPTELQNNYYLLILQSEFYDKIKKSGVSPLDFPNIWLLSGIYTSLNQSVFQYIFKKKKSVIYKII